MIPVSSPYAQFESHSAAVQEAVQRVLWSGRYILGAEVECFESEFASFCGSRHAVAVANGTDAITIALLALGIGPGEEVITVSHTAVATIAGIVRAGARPIMVDIDPSTWTIDPDAVSAAIGRRTRAIVPVHLYGRPADMTAISEIARRNRLVVVEDCAQAHGAAWQGQRVGSFSDAATFSFYPTKNLGAVGDGGAITFREAAAAGQARRIREYGWDKERISRSPGFNSRLDEMQAAILRAKLPSLEKDNARRAELAACYSSAFADLPMQLPPASGGAIHVWHLYVIACPERDALMRHIAQRGVAAAIHYPRPAHRHPGLGCDHAGALPYTDKAAAEVLSLPIYPELTQTEADTVIKAVRSFFELKA